jgi:uncharacterized protein YjbI with pentapeptide repeats
MNKIFIPSVSESVTVGRNQSFPSSSQVARAESHAKYTTIRRVTISPLSLCKYCYYSTDGGVLRKSQSLQTAIPPRFTKAIFHKATFHQATFHQANLHQATFHQTTVDDRNCLTELIDVCNCDDHPVRTLVAGRWSPLYLPGTYFASSAALDSHSVF